MRILALLTDGFGANGGIARYNQNLLTALSQSTAVSDIFALPRFATPMWVPAKVRQLSPSPSRVRWAARAVALAARQRFDAVFCGHLNAAPLSAMLARLQRVPLWAQVHGIEAWQPRGRAYGCSLAEAELITSVSRVTRSRLLAWTNIPPERVRVLSNTIAPKCLPTRECNDLRARHGLFGRRVILTVGRLAATERYKGHDRVIAALPAIVARVPDALYLIVGSGSDQPRLASLACEAGVAARVVFAGNVADDELPDYFALADVFAMPSTGEGFGIVFLEAAAAGLPVIAGNCDGSVDALADGRIGRLIDPRSREELVAAVIEALISRQPAAAAEFERFSFARFSEHVDQLVRGLAR